MSMRCLIDIRVSLVRSEVYKSVTVVDDIAPQGKLVNDRHAPQLTYTRRIIWELRTASF